MRMMESRYVPECLLKYNRIKSLITQHYNLTMKKEGAPEKDPKRYQLVSLKSTALVPFNNGLREKEKEL